MTDHPVSPSLARVVAGYSLSRVSRHLLGVLLAFLRPKILGPEFFGLWTMLKVIPTYAGYLHLGSRTGLRLALPGALGRGDHGGAARMRGAVLGLCIVTHLAAVAFLAALALVAPWSAAARLGVAVMAVVILVQFAYEFLVTNLKAEQRFDLIGATNYLLALLSVVVAVPLLLLWGYYGLLAGLLLPPGAAILFILRCYRPRVGLNLDRRLLAPLFALGLPAFLFQLGITLVVTCDRFLIAWLLDSRQLGYYGLALLLLALLGNLPGAAREVMEPQLMAEAGGEEERVRQVRRYLVAPMAPAALYLPYAILAGYVLLPLVLSWILPAYLPAVTACRILLVGFYFLALSHPPRTMVIACRRQGAALGWLSAVLLCNLAAGYGAVIGGLGINGVALASAASFGLVTAAQFVVLWPWLGGGGRRLALLLLLAAAAMLAAVLVVQAVPWPPVSGAGTGARLAAGLGSYGILHLVALRRLGHGLDQNE